MFRTEFLYSFGTNTLECDTCIALRFTLHCFLVFVQAKRNRIAELSVGLMPRESRCKSQWDFVIEEMIWLANDFTQVCLIEPFLLHFDFPLPFSYLLVNPEFI